MYFTCEIRNVKVNGVEIKNALIVSGMQNGPSQPDLTFLIPEAYRGADIMGKRYIHEELRFELVDSEPEVHEPTQLDRVEELTLQNTINTEYLVALKELGL